MVAGFGHLGAHRVSDLVDGHLSAAEQRHSLDHAAGCPECSAEIDRVQAQRAAASSLRTPPVPVSLHDKLLALPQHPETAAEVIKTPGMTSRRVLALCLAVSVGLVVTTAVLYALGAPQRRSPDTLTAILGDASTHHLDQGELSIAELPGQLDVSTAQIDEWVTLGDTDAVRVGDAWFAQVGDLAIAVSGPRDDALTYLTDHTATTTSPTQRIAVGLQSLLGASQ